MSEEKYRPKIIAFCCNWCSYAGADLAGNNRLEYPADVKIIRIPCSCRLNPTFILRAFGRGADGVILCGCHPGDCHYSTGNYFTRRRMKVLFSLLNFMGIDEGRTRVEWVSAAEGAKFAATMNEFVDKIRELGPNRKLTDLRLREDVIPSEVEESLNKRPFDKLRVTGLQSEQSARDNHLSEQAARDNHQSEQANWGELENLASEQAAGGAE